MVPQAMELEPLLGALAAVGYRPRDLALGRLDCHCFDELGLLVAVGGHGKTQLAVQTQHLIEQRPTARSVICAGAARAARFSGLRFLKLRAITDAADHAAASDFEANLARSMPNLGHLLLSWSLARAQP